MKSQLHRHLLLICLLAGSAATMQAQITIGSAGSPTTGALLDLKQDGTTKKGLGLPRVELKDLHKLTMGTNEIADEPTQAGTSTIWKDHEGLVVFHISSQTPKQCDEIPEDVYVWDGSKWNSLQGKIPADKTKFVDMGNTGLLTDYEGNTYPTKKIGSKHWTTVNSRSIRDKDGKFIDCTNGLRLNPAYYGTPAGTVKVQWDIPSGIVSDYTNANNLVTAQSYKDFANEFGLLYSWSQAMKACPMGWRLPTTDDWTELASSIGGVLNGDSYDNIGHLMKKNPNTTYKAAESGIPSLNWTGGVAVSNPSGFEAVPAGNIAVDGTYAISFSIYTYWWTTSNNAFYYLSQGNSLTKETVASKSYYSVRCVQE